MRSWLGICVAVLVGAGIGFFVGSDNRGVPDGPRSAGTPATELRASRLASETHARDHARQDRLLEQLLVEVRDLGVLRHRPPGDPDDPRAVSERTPVEGSGPDDTIQSPTATLDPELRAWLAKIDARMENLMRSPGTLPVIAIPPRGVRPHPLPVPSIDDEEQAEFSSDHILWSYQDVIDTYGRPDIVHDGNEWEYTYRGEIEAGRELNDIHFVFSGGYVVHMYAH